jgi:hypothetical protein
LLFLDSQLDREYLVPPLFQWLRFSAGTHTPSTVLSIFGHAALFEKSFRKSSPKGLILGLKSVD